jgi:hypothetical protein
MNDHRQGGPTALYATTTKVCNVACEHSCDRQLQHHPMVNPSKTTSPAPTFPANSPPQTLSPYDCFFRPLIVLVATHRTCGVDENSKKSALEEAKKVQVGSTRVRRLLVLASRSTPSPWRRWWRILAHACAGFRCFACSWVAREGGSEPCECIMAAREGKAR